MNTRRAGLATLKYGSIEGASRQLDISTILLTVKAFMCLIKCLCEFLHLVCVIYDYSIVA